MIPYYITFFLSLIAFHLSNKGKNTYLLLISLVVLVVLSAFRDMSVGTDTVNYALFFEQILTFDDVLNRTKFQGEFGFWTLNFFARSMFDNYFMILLFNALIVYGLYFKGILKTDKHLTFIFFCFLFLGPNLFHFNGARQGIAIAFFFIAFWSALEKKVFYFLLWILLGFMMHKSIILCLPLYFFINTQFNGKKVALLTFGFAFIMYTFADLITLASEIDSRYESYGEEQTDYGGFFTSLFNLLLLLFFFMSKYLNKIRYRVYDAALSLFYIGVLIGVLSVILKVNPSGFLRLSVYFTQFAIILVPYSIMSFSKYEFKVMAFIFFVGLITMKFHFSTQAFSHLAPYTFNPLITIGI
jgi:hypothetical protein